MRYQIAKKLTYQVTSYPAFAKLGFAVEAVAIRQHINERILSP